MQVAALVAAARERTGHDDFGEDDWQEGLEVLVRSLDAEAALNELGRAALTDLIVGFLVNRLEVEHAYALHPEIDDEVIEAPLFGLGLPRTGSTATSYLIAADRSRRTLRVWEASQPCPPPELATERADPRIAAAQAGIDLTNAMFPDFVGMVPTEAEGPQECLLLLGLALRTQMFEAMARVPGYSDWLLHCDMGPAYRYHRRVLKLLQWRRPPGRWSLRSPAHMHAIDALDAVYPDARFVMTHRDVGEVLPSVCALYASLSGVLTDAPDPAAVGRHNLELWGEALDRLVAFRDRGHEHRFVDLAFVDVQRDPLGAMDRLYAALGDELTGATRAAMGEWWARSAGDRPAPRGSDPARFGLDPGAIADRFAAYHRRFGLG